MKATVLGKAIVCALGGALLFSCTADQDIKCGAGTELVAGRCVALDGSMAGSGGDGGPSVEGTPCGEGAVVLDGSCQGLRPIGSACDTGEQCESGSCLKEDRGAKDGYCTTVACSANRPCPAGSRCYYASTEEQFLCLAYCDDEDDCRDGYACQPLYTSDASVCAPSCAVTGACPAGTLCDQDSGKCLLHECELGASGACGADDDAGTSGAAGDLICYADRLGISSSGAVCLPACDPGANESNCARNEVCQPLPEDPAHSGLCVPPLCSSTEECSAGAVCMNGVCQPPARCDEDGACAGDYVCVGGKGGQCMPPCPESGDEGCAAIHSGLSCASTLGACLPTGSYPGSVCRSDLNAPCDALTVRDGGETTVTPMLCDNGLCLASCAEGGSDLCEAISGTLTCAQDVLAAPVCLPKGSFPGGPCDADDACAPLMHGGQSLPMACAQGQCLVTCDDAAGGDLLCDAIDASLVCIADAFATTTDMCLPRGAYPGGPCGPGDSCSTGMTCEDNRCLYQCGTGGEAFCNGVNAGLSCATGVYAEPVCLPRGTFPGSPCRPTGGDECDQDLRGLPDADMVCSSGTCAVQCQSPGVFASGNALCGVINPSLTCLSNPGTDVCVIACGDGDACPAGYSCLTSQHACLPTGSFLGSPCANGTTCSGSTPPLACAPGATPTCAAACSSAGMPSAYCEGLAPMFGQTWDTCTGAGLDGALICVDATP